MSRNYHSFPEPSGTAAGRNHPDDSGRADSASKIAPLYKPPGNQNEPDCATLARFARRLVDADGKASTLEEIRSSIDLQGVNDPNGVAEIVGVKASATMDLTDLIAYPEDFVAGDQITFSEITFSFVETADNPPVAGEVVIGEDIDETVANLITEVEVNLPGLSLSWDTPILTCEAVDAGTENNEFPVSTPEGATYAWSSETLEGGVDAVAAIPAISAVAGTVYNQIDDDDELVAVWVSNGDGTWNKKLVANADGNIVTSTNYAQTPNGEGNILIPDEQGIRWFKRDGTLSDFSIRPDEEHDTFGGELYIGSPWRIAFLQKGIVQMARNDEGRYPRLWRLVSGYSSDANEVVNFMPSGVMSWQTSAWDGTLSGSARNVQNEIMSQAKALDNSGTNSVLQFFDQAEVQGQNGGGGVYTPGQGEVQGNLIAEIYKDGIWHPGQAPAFDALTDGATITITCSKYKTVQAASVTLADNRTLIISGAIAGMRGVIYVTQDGTGSRTLTPSEGSALGLSTAANATDRVDWDYDGLYYNFAVQKAISRVVIVGDTDAAAFIAAASITDTTQKAAIATLVGSLKAESLWDKIYAAYPFVGGNATAHSKDLKAGYNGTFGGTVTHDDHETGTITGSTDGYFDTGFISSAIEDDEALNSLSVYCYCRREVLTASKYLFGASDADSSRIGIYAKADLAYIENSGIHANALIGTVSVARDYRKHFFQMRDSATTMRLIVGTNWSAGFMVNVAASCDAKLHFLARGTAAARDNFSNAKLGFGMIGQKFTQAEHLAFIGIVDAFQTTLGRKNP